MSNIPRRDCRVYTLLYQKNKTFSTQVLKVFFSQMRKTMHFDSGFSKDGAPEKTERIGV